MTIRYPFVEYSNFCVTIGKGETGVLLQEAENQTTYQIISAFIIPFYTEDTNFTILLTDDLDNDYVLYRGFYTPSLRTIPLTSLEGFVIPPEYNLQVSFGSVNASGNFICNACSFVNQSVLRDYKNNKVPDSGGSLPGDDESNNPPGDEEEQGNNNQPGDNNSEQNNEQDNQEQGGNNQEPNNEPNNEQNNEQNQDNQENQGNEQNNQNNNSGIIDDPNMEEINTDVNP